MIRILLASLLSLAPLMAQTVRDHGAVGDGRADDTVAFERAVEAGDGLRLPPGRYRLTRTIEINLDERGPVSVSGDGSATVVMEGPGPALRLVGTHAGTADPETVEDRVWLRQRAPLVDGFEIVGAHPKAVGVEVSGAMQPILSRLTIRRGLHGIVLTGRNRNVLIESVQLYENRGVGLLLDQLNLHQINVVGSHISYNGGGGIVVRNSEIRNLHIGTCDIESNMAPDQPPTANIFIDVRNGSVREGAIVGSTLQHNHDAAGSANIWMLGRAEEPRKAGYFSISANALSDVQVNVRLEHVRGVSITGNSFWKGFQQNLLVVGSSNIVVGPNVFDRNPDYRPVDSLNGIVFDGVRDSTISGAHLNGSIDKAGSLVIRRSKGINIDGIQALNSRGPGVVIADSERVRLSDSIVRNEEAEDGWVALRVSGGSGIRLSDNEIEGKVDAEASSLAP